MKHCIECGCNMPDNHEGNMCEVCLEERDGTVSDSSRAVENKEEEKDDDICYEY